MSAEVGGVKWFWFREEAKRRRMLGILFFVGV
jgi:hypothetical protein